MKKYWFISIVLLAIDQATKLWAESRLIRGVVEIWPGIIRFRYARNTGAAFSMLYGNNTILTVATLVMIAVVLFVYFKEKSFGDISRGGLVLVVFGGIGNILDRITRGYVVDFIEPVFIDFAIFNIADVAVCLGAVLIVVGVIIKGRPDNAVDG